MAEKKQDKKKKRNLQKIPKSVQDTIPYIGVYKNGIIETTEGYFTKSYLLEDIDFKTASDEAADMIFETFGKLLNTFDATMLVQFTINNRHIDRKDFEKQILTKLRGDSLDELREENNQILRDKLKEGRSNMQHIKYMTVSMEAESVDEAVGLFSRLDSEISNTLKSISGGETLPLTLLERLELLYNILNRDESDSFYQKALINGKEAESFNYKWMKKQGLTTKDLIAPSSMQFAGNYIKLDNKYARVLHLSNLPTKLSTDMLADVTELPIDMVTTINVQPIEPTAAAKMVQRQLTKTKKDVMTAQKQAAKNGYDSSLIPEKTKDAYEEADILMNELTHGDQKLFLTNLLVMLYADSKDELDKDTQIIRTSVEKHLCKFKTLTGLQELGFLDSIPVCRFALSINTLLTTQSASVFMPYTTRELNEKDGFYYGQNAVSRNMIIYNRKLAVNSNGIILGMPGTGKSFSAKREIVNVALNTNDMIYILDPQGEYTPLVKLLGGESIEIRPGSGLYLNPLDMDIEYADDGDPVTMKSDYVCSICEIVLAGPYGLMPTQKAIINRCVRYVYKDYMKHMMDLKNSGSDKTIDKEAMPTLQDFYEVLLMQDEEDARYIATALELYTSGSFDTFAHRTNVVTDSRIIAYNISGMGESMRELGLNVCLNNIWNQIIENHKKGIRTWIYLDEFHLLTRLDSSAEFTKKVYKMARKWGAIPTGITQNVEDLLVNEKARALINNCTFVYMLSQSPRDRDDLQAIYNIPDSQIPYITNGGYGRGLIYNGKSTIPFIDEFPSDTKLYRAMTTKPEDFVANL
jgi:type IV secretory pathway VirB4 component